MGIRTALRAGLCRCWRDNGAGSVFGSPVHSVSSSRPSPIRAAVLWPRFSPSRHRHSGLRRQPDALALRRAEPVHDSYPVSGWQGPAKPSRHARRRGGPPARAGWRSHAERHARRATVGVMLLREDRLLVRSSASLGLLPQVRQAHARARGSAHPRRLLIATYPRDYPSPACRTGSERCSAIDLT